MKQDIKIKNVEDICGTFDILCQKISSKKDSSTYMRNLSYKLLSAVKGRNRAGFCDTILRFIANIDENSDKKKFSEYIRDIVYSSDEDFDKIAYSLVSKVVKYS